MFALKIEAIGGAAPSPRVTPPAEPDPLWEAARDLEAAMVGELLSHAGLDEAIGGGAGFGGGAFASLAVRSYAEHFVEFGGLGLAEKIYARLKESER